MLLSQVCMQLRGSPAAFSCMPYCGAERQSFKLPGEQVRMWERCIAPAAKGWRPEAGVSECNSMCPASTTSNSSCCTAEPSMHRGRQPSQQPQSATASAIAAAAVCHGISPALCDRCRLPS